MASAAFGEENDESLLLSLSRDITSCRTKEDVQNMVVSKLAHFFKHNDILISLNEPDNLTHKVYIHSVRREIKRQLELSEANQRSVINDGIFDVLENSMGPVVFDMDELVRRVNKPSYVEFWYHQGARELIGFVLRVNNESIGGATLYPREKKTFSGEQLRLAQAICSYVGIALWNIRNYEKIQTQLEEIKQYKSQLELENKYLQEHINTANSFTNVIGSEEGLKDVFQLVSNVATSDSTVMIQGETGTGKELIARAIHNTSPRKNKLMVKINCAALPPQLIESELFGHEKGSFTGATERRIGKFELANNSTLFLDEIGEMPLELQVKLLRAIQEKEIERVGGKSVIRTNVRLIAATNRDLQKDVEAGRFRHDLYYRLNVFPINLPPLRERKGDIPALVTSFIQRFSARSGRPALSISPAVVKQLTIYDWPGNVRELEHVIERSVLMTQGQTIKEVLLPVNSGDQLTNVTSSVKSLAENEREYILTVLKKCDGKVRSAAALLGVPPTTLHSKMKKLGIRKTVS
jgi:formate hydrogenlyase transcriptional activator